MFISTPFFHLTQNCDACVKHKENTTAELQLTKKQRMIQLWSLPNILTQNKQIEVEGSLHKLDALAKELCDPNLYPDRGPKDMYDSLFVRNHPRKECDTGKNQRRMAPLTGEQFEFCSQAISSRLQSQDLFNDGRQLLEELVVIRSYEGCPEQGRHSDYNAGQLAEVPDTGIPLSVLWALEDGSQLILFGRNGTRVVLPVLKGKFVVFRGDLGHAGAGYKQMNMRVHCYVSLKDKVQRLENKTYFMSQHFFVPRSAQASGQVGRVGSSRAKHRGRGTSNNASRRWLGSDC